MNDLWISRSKSNQVLFFGMILATLALYVVDRLIVGQPTLWTEVLALLTIGQGLRTYVRRTRFGSDKIEHLTSFGRKRVAEYPELSILERKGEAIVIVGEKFEVTLRKRDGDLAAVSEILRRKVARYLAT